MTEREYIDATNLAKLRVAIYALNNTIGRGLKERDDAIAALYRWQGELEKKVATSS